jgi:Phytanoyl-CoA dioxygenase (PhyH)
VTVPYEFTPEAVETRSPVEEQLYTSFLKNRDLEEPILGKNPWLLPPDHSKPLEWGTGRYWDTTVARKHEFWRQIDLPLPTKDIRQMRHDLREWGYCLIEEGMSTAQCERLLTRLLEQAEGERLAGIEQQSPYGQYVYSLINKGECFAKCIEQNPEAVQAGPVIEQLMDETLGDGWICHAFLAHGADPGRWPQALHIDQGALLPWITKEAPILMNTMFILEDVNEVNGGTLIIPGSHKVMVAAVNGETVERLPPAINLEACAGTIMVFDGRLLHGTGANRSSKRRFVLTMSNVKSWMRQQEVWLLSAAPEVLERASPKLLHRIGFQSIFNCGAVEGFGVNFAQGRVGEPEGALKMFREAVDAGVYRRVGELRPTSSEQELQKEFTVREAIAASQRASG